MKTEEKAIYGFFLAVGALIVAYGGYQTWVYYFTSAGKTVLQLQCSWGDWILGNCGTGKSTPSTVQNY